jgi:8-oxo-dGTP diphosphatase
VWATRTAAFTLTDRAGALLLVRHERLGVVGWEPPGGHVDGGETAEQAAARETVEETGVDVEVGRLVATCVHEWAEREERRVLLFFAARAVGTGRPRPHPGIAAVAWLDPRTTAGLSPFLPPILDGRLAFFRAVHVRDAAGRWRPQVLAQ